MKRLLTLAGLTAVAVPVLVLGNAGIAAADYPDAVLTVGVPTYYANGLQNRGAIDNRPQYGSGQLLTEESLGVDDAVPGARFGAAVLTGDLNGDRWDDMIVGVPGTPGTTSTPDVPGQVDIFFGTENGIVAAGHVVLPSPAVAGDEFGAALSISTRADEGDPDTGIKDLWVGAPDHDVNGQKDAGAIYRYSIDSAGTATFVETITQDSPLVPGASEAGDHFGAVLSGAARNGTVVGVPDEDIATLKDAGTVQRLRTDETTDTLIAGTDWNQNTKGVPGVAEAGDHFGAAVSSDGNAIGVPGEDIGKVKDAGEVQTFGNSARGTDSLVPSVVYTQNTKGVPGTAEAGDRFGASVSQGLFQCEEQVSVAIGAPGEDIGTIKDAGSVTVLLEPALSGLKTFSQCPAAAYSQGSGFPGKAEAGDETGATVGVYQGDPDLDEDRMDEVLTGVPGEDVDNVADAGRVFFGTGKYAQSYGYQNGNVPGMRYGSVFADASVTY